MTDLTEQWKKGELPSGWYYVKCLCENEDRIDYYNASFGCWTSNDKYIKQVLAPVPSYNEWQAKLEENAQLKKQINHLLRTQARHLLIIKSYKSKLKKQKML